MCSQLLLHYFTRTEIVSIVKFFLKRYSRRRKGIHSRKREQSTGTTVRWTIPLLPPLLVLLFDLILEFNLDMDSLTSFSCKLHAGEKTAIVLDRKFDFWSGDCDARGAGGSGSRINHNVLTSSACAAHLTSRSSQLLSSQVVRRHEESGITETGVT